MRRTKLRRPHDPRLRRVLLAIGVITVVSGAVQAAVPDRLLRLLAARDDDAARTMFATIGMFMVVAGGTLVQGLLSSTRQPVIVLWAAVQKFGAAVAVTTGVRRRVYSPLALLVAGFDLLTSVLAALHWARIRRH